MGIFKGIHIAFFIIGIGFAIALPIACFVIAAQNWNSSCGIMAVVRLPIWLVVQGVVDFVIGLLFWLCFFMYVISEREKFLIPYIIMLIINGLFLIPWNIIGAVSLFSDSMDCQNVSYSLWVLVIVVLAFQWFSILNMCCRGRRSKK